MMQIAFLASPPPQKSQKLNLKNLTSAHPHLISSLRSTFAGHPPPDPLLTHFVRQTQLSWRLLRRLAFVKYPLNNAKHRWIQDLN